MLRRIAMIGWLIALIGSAPVYGQSAATFASGNGDDNDDCLTPATACRQISAALTKTLAGGTIHVLAGTYLKINVTQSVNIIAKGAASIIDSGSPPAINISTNPGVVRVSGFLMDGAIQGISFVGSGFLSIEHCTLEPNSSFALDFKPTGTTQLSMADTTVSGPNGFGIMINPSGSARVEAVLDLVRVKNSGWGLNVVGSATSGSIGVALRNSIIAGSSNFGVNAFEPNAGTTNVMIEGSVVTDNGSQGVISNGANSTVRMRNSTVRQTFRGLQIANGGKLVSHGGNVIVDNVINGAFTATVPTQ